MEWNKEPIRDELKAFVLVARSSVFIAKNTKTNIYADWEARLSIIFNIWDDLSQVWWHTPVISVLGRLRQEDRCKFETSLGYKSEPKASLSYIARPCLKKKKKKSV